MLDTIFGARDQGCAYFTVVSVLAVFSERMGVTIHPPKDAVAHRVFLSEPYARADDQDIAGINFGLDVRPVVSSVAVFSDLVLLPACRYHLIYRPQNFTGDAVGLANLFGPMQQSFGVRHLGRATTGIAPRLHPHEWDCSLPTTQQTQAGQTC